MLKRTIVGVLLALAAPAVARDATSAVAPRMTAAEQVVVQRALDRGQLLYAYDQAAWHATDAMQAAAAATGSAATLSQRVAGWIVRGSEDAPEVIFYDRDPATPHAVYVARMSDHGRTVASSRFVAADENGVIDTAGLAMIRARQSAVAFVESASLQRCARGPFNTVVLAPAQVGGVTLVYLLAPQEATDRVPFGGHYRIEVSADGHAAPPHAFTRTCLDLPTRGAREHPAAILSTQINDPLPTEIAVYTMMAAGLPLFVRTAADDRIWELYAPGGQATIRLTDPPSRSTRDAT